MNILQTLHPPDKDYGHMKIDEPKTPYHADVDSEYDMEEPNPVLNTDDLTARLQGNALPKVLSDHNEPEDHMTPEEKIRHNQFLMRRKQHYNEFENIRRARQLMAEESEDED